MTAREHRRYSNTPLQRERIARQACPVCGREREAFTGDGDAICCGPSCRSLYWRDEHPTVGEMRRLVLLEQEGKCARCHTEIPAARSAGGRRPAQPFVLDHIRPLAMGGDQWDPRNLQVLCARCNRIKTARDIGAIARWKRYACRGLARQEDRTWLAGGDYVPGAVEDC